MAWSASKIKQNKTGYFDARHSYLGDSFSIYSFVYLHWHAAKLSTCYTLPTLGQKDGVAPGFRMPLRLTAKLAQRLVYGSPESSLLDKSKTLSDLNRFLLRKTNHTGSDIRVIFRGYYNSKAFPRQSIAADWWSWEHAFARPWKRRAHINVLELETICGESNFRWRTCIFLTPGSFRLRTPISVSA